MHDYVGSDHEVYDSYDNSATSGSEAPELGPLGLINGEYQIQSSDLDDWSQYNEDEFSLIMCLCGNSVWGAYDFGMHSGIIYLPDRPYAASHDELPFTWRGRENGEGEISFGPGNTGWIRFLGNGKIEGMITCYGQAKFTGQRISGNDTRAPRDARSMRDEWDGYNQREYDRANRARWGGSGGW
jgi:hypothetical protein